MGIPPFNPQMRSVNNCVNNFTNIESLRVMIFLSNIFHATRKIIFNNFARELIFFGAREVFLLCRRARKS